MSTRRTPRTAKLRISMTPALKARLAAIAISAGIPMSEAALRIITERIMD